jgi:membrane protein DedA with SNARE-associated domain
MAINYRHSLVLGSIASLGLWVYPAIALAIFLEGEAVIYSVMFLTFEGMLKLKFTLPIVCASVLATDFISYQVGVYGPRFFPRLAKFYSHLTAPLDDRLRSLSFTVYLISKFTYGMHRAVLIRSGMIGVPFKKLLKINLVTSAIWIATITGAAYASWQSISYIGKSLRYIEVVLLVGIIVILLGSHFISHLTKIKLLK